MTQRGATQRRVPWNGANDTCSANGANGDRTR